METGRDCGRSWDAGVWQQGQPSDVGTDDNRASRLEVVNLVLRCRDLKHSLSQELYGEYTNQLVRNIN